MFAIPIFKEGEFKSIWKRFGSSKRVHNSSYFRYWSTRIIKNYPDAYKHRDTQKKHKRLTEIRKWSKKNHKNCNTSGRTTNKYRQQPFRLYSAKNGRDRFRVTPPTGSLPPKTVAYKRDRDARLQGSVFSKSSHRHTRSTGARSPLLLSPPPKGQSQKFGIIFISQIFVTNGNCRLLV